MMTKTDITQVSYRGTAPAMTDIAAVVDVMFTGRLRPWRWRPAAR